MQNIKRFINVHPSLTRRVTIEPTAVEEAGSPEKYMYVVTVRFEVVPTHMDEFRPRMIAQANNSLSAEAGCHQFDVCFSDDQPNVCFLYEKYKDRAAFDQHLASNHFLEFDATVQPWIVSKEVHTWTAVATVGDGR